MFSKRTDWKLEENAYTRAARRLRESGKPLFDLTLSNPTACGFHYDEAAILDALRTSAAVQYEPDPKGLSKAREAIAQYYEEKKQGAHVDLERLILTTGTSEAYSFLFRLLCEPGDEVLVAHPSYPLFDFLATIQDVALRPFQLVYDHGWQIDFQSLRRAIGSRTRAVLLVHPNNPTGNFIGADEAEELGALCQDNSLALVVDEVFLDYETRGTSARKRRHGSFVSNDPTLTFVLSGLSKIAGLPQMKVGWIAASGPDAQVREALARLEVIADTYLSLSGPLQHAVPKLMGQRYGVQSQIRARRDANLRELDRQLVQQTLVSALEVEGGWYAVLRVPAVRSDEELAIHLMDRQNVLVHPGHFYDFQNEGYLVASLLPLLQKFSEGIDRLLACVARG
jgi:alanine-synthesizing transaminase